MKNVNQYEKKCSRAPISRLLLLGCVSVLAAYGHSSSVQAANPNYVLNKSNGVTPYASHYIYGTLAGLPTGSWIDIKNNANAPQILKTNGKFKLSKGVAAGHTYHVTVVKDPYISGKDPLPYKCAVLHGQGVMPEAHVEDVQITCAADVIEEPSFKAMHTFTNKLNTLNGSKPHEGLVQDKTGNFYGTTYEGGENNFGTVFKITPKGELTTLAHFGSGSGPTLPDAALILGIDGDLYGTSMTGGIYNSGTIFTIKPDGSGMTVLHSFEKLRGAPRAGLIEVSKGVFYGTASHDNSRANKGSVFKITINSDSATKRGTFVPVHEFNGMDGDTPYSPLVQDGDLLYGTTLTGGQNNSGTIYSIKLSGELHSVYSFLTTDQGKEGHGPLAKDGYGNFYGVTRNGGMTNKGTLYQFNPKENKAKTLIHFGYENIKGVHPAAGLTLDKDGHFYGTTQSQPILFKFVPPTTPETMGELKTLHMFDINDNVPAGVLQGLDGNLYGTTVSGGSSRLGIVYKFGM